MNDLHHLASAVSQVSPYRRRPRARAKTQHSSAPLVLAIVVGSIIIGGAIIYFATRSRPGPQQQAADNSAQNAIDDIHAKEVATQQTRAQVAQFKDFATRLAETLASARKAALQAENPPTADLVVKYTCNYMLGQVDAHTTRSGRPGEFFARFSGVAEGTGEGYHSKDTTELTTAFVPDAAGKWKIARATEQPISHSSSTDFMGVPEKGGPKRDIAHIDWFNAAVVAAQKQVTPQ